MLTLPLLPDSHGLLLSNEREGGGRSSENLEALTGPQPNNDPLPLLSMDDDLFFFVAPLILLDGKRIFFFLIPIHPSHPSIGSNPLASSYTLFSGCLPFRMVCNRQKRDTKAPPISIRLGFLRPIQPTMRYPSAFRRSVVPTHTSAIIEFPLIIIFDPSWCQLISKNSIPISSSNFLSAMMDVMDMACGCAKNGIEAKDLPTIVDSHFYFSFVTGTMDRSAVIKHVTRCWTHFHSSLEKSIEMIRRWRWIEKQLIREKQRCYCLLHSHLDLYNGSVRVDQGACTDPSIRFLPFCIYSIYPVIRNEIQSPPPSKRIQ